MYHPRVSGPYYEMGHKYGGILHSHGFKPPKPSAREVEFAKKSEREVKRVFPMVLDEIHGFADACHTRFEDVASFLFGIGVFKPEGACSEFASFSGSDVVFGRNYDFYYKYKKYTESYVTRPDGAYSSLGHSDIFIGREDGVNENGLAIAISFVAQTQPKPGINFPFAVRCVLDNCGNVREALKILSEATFSTANNYLVADREGNMAVVEVSSRRVRIRRPDDSHYLVATNHFVHSEMLDIEDKEKRDPTSTSRYTTICEALHRSRGKFDAKSAQRVLSSHQGHVCSHVEKEQLGTLWSVTATLKHPTLYRAEGHPCTAPYKADTRLKLLS